MDENAMMKKARVSFALIFNDDSRSKRFTIQIFLAREGNKYIRNKRIGELKSGGKKKSLFLSNMNRPEKGVVETRVYYTWMGEDGVARTQVKPGAQVVLADARENSAAVNGLEGPLKYPLIVDTREITSITKEARDYFSLRGRESRVVAFAMVIDSPLSRIIGNFFLGLNKPRVPARLFTDCQSAAEWCRKFQNPETLR